MKPHAFTIAFLFPLLVQAQVFNKPMFISANQQNPSVMRANEATYVSMFSAINPGGSFHPIYKINESGEVIASDSLDSPSAGWNNNLGYMYPSDYKLLPDSSFFISGNYIKGCDVLLGSGAFIVHYDKDLNRIKDAAFKDSSTQSYQLIELDSGGYAMEGNSSIIGFDDSFVKTSHWFDSTSYFHKGSIHLSGDQFLRKSQLVTSGRDTAYYYDIHSDTTYNASVFGHNLFNLSDSSFISRDISDKLVLYEKSNLQKVDSADVPPLVGFQPEYYDYSSQAILVADTQHYAILSKADFTLIETGLLQSNSDYASAFTGDMYYRDSVVTAATGMRSGQVNLESFRIGQSKAPAFQTLAVNAKALNFQISKIDSVAANYRRVYATADWEVTVYNQSPDTVEQWALSYSYDNNYNCRGDNHLVEMGSLVLLPGDSTSITLNDLDHANVIPGANFSYYLNVAPIMANDNILKSGAWNTNNYTIQNVSLPENRSLASMVKIYPNPTHDKLWLEFKESFEVILPSPIYPVKPSFGRKRIYCPVGS